MDLSQIKMVVTDLDGTLLNSQHEVSPRFFELFQELRKKDILFVAASGRHYDSMMSKLSSIKDDSIVMSGDGAMVKHQDTVLLTTPMHTSGVSRVLECVQPLEGVYPILCTQDNVFVQDDSEELRSVLREHYPNFTKIEDLTAVEAAVLEVYLYHAENSEKHIYPAVKHLEDILKVRVAVPYWVDLSHPNAHKGYALVQLMEQYQIAPQEMMVFGDHLNDLEMLQLTDFSFAMANAHPDIKKVAKYQTGSNDAFGVETILEQLL